MKKLNLLTVPLIIVMSLFITSFAFAEGEWATSGNNIYSTNSGNVGIGTTAPGANLDVNGQIRVSAGTNYGLEVYSGTSLYGNLGGTSNGLAFRSADGSLAARFYNGWLIYNGAVSFKNDADSIYNVSITNSGNVGIGTTGPAGKLQVVAAATDRVVLSNDTSGDVNTNSPKLSFYGWNTSSSNIVGPSIQKVHKASYGRGDLVFWQHGGADYSSETEAMVITYNGKVGIGTTAPSGNLEVAGGGELYLDDLNAGGNSNLRFMTQGTTIGHIYAEDSDTTLRLRSGTTTDGIIIKSNGNVGIGTTSPNNKLDVKGIIRAEEVKVETGWSDFVFEDNYPLPSLDHVESFIKENKHLPDIPSAEEVKEQGLSVSEMMAKQMQKIEELTLYVIEQNKRLDQVEKENQELKDELAELKNMN